LWTLRSAQREDGVDRRRNNTQRANMPPAFDVRPASMADVSLIADHRARMFRDMGLVPDDLFGSFRARCEARLRQMLESGEYLGWLACPNEQAERIVAGAGVQLRRVLPHPAGESPEVTIAEGRHAIIINVFTEPEWRRQGLATLLLREIIAWARNERLDRLVLHASDEGRPVYERLGFIQTNEMRFKERLDQTE
jgi:GNAT superfamily N-acetyltransferase